MRQTVNTIVGRRAAIGSRRISKLAPTSGWPRSAGFLSGRLFPRVVPAPRCIDGNGLRHSVTAMTTAEAIAMARYSAPPAGLFFGTPSHLIIALVTDGTPTRSDHRDRLAHLPAVAGIERQPRARAGQRGQSKC